MMMQEENFYLIARENSLSKSLSLCVKETRSNNERKIAVVLSRGVYRCDASKSAPFFWC
jgi:hypothetical protein